MEPLLGVVLFGFWVYCIVDVALSDGSQVRNLPKWGWLAVVVLLWVLGAVLWWLLGRPFRTYTEGDRRETTHQRLPGRPMVTRRSRSGPGERTEDESVVRARIEERDRLLARWKEEDRRKPPKPPGEADRGQAPPAAT